MTLRLRADDLEWREIDDEIILLDAREGTYLSVTGSGSLLWQAIVSGTTREELAKTLVEAYAIDDSRAAADAEAFVASLASQGLLE